MRTISILGAGESGTGAALLAKQKGWEVFVSDQNTISPLYKEQLLRHQIDFEENQHTLKKILSADVIIKSPGIPEETSIIQEMKSHQKKIIDEIEFATQYTKGYQIAITGTNGKSTLATLIHHMLTKSKMEATLVGNIGKSFAGILTKQQKDYYVIELSNFQLHNTFTFRPNVGIITNITPDHLDRYQGDFEQYAADKLKLIQAMKAEDYFIYNADDETIKKQLSEITSLATQIPVSLKEHQLEQGVYIADKEIHFKLPKTPEWNLALHYLNEFQQMNLLNMMIAMSVGMILEIPYQTFFKALKKFTGLPHRRELVVDFKGIKIYNDSKATNVAATYQAIASLKKNIIWIAGGVDKKNDYNVILSLAKKCVKKLICLGKENTPLKKAFKNSIREIQETMNLQEAIDWAFEDIRPGDIILLSPMCASFDLFNNYEDRGNQFKKAVFRKIKQIESL